MTPEDLAARHPSLYHVTWPEAWDSIHLNGLLPASALLDRFEAPAAVRQAIGAAPRTGTVTLTHPLHGTATLNDQLPMRTEALRRCLDDGLSPSDWLAILDSRVFFWSDERGLHRLLGSRANRGRTLLVLEIGALALAQAYADRIELSAINSGATMRKPARRGRATFTPMLAHSYQEWSRLRGQRDRILELTVRGSVPDIATYITETRQITLA